MDSSLRPSGLSILGDMRWGSHLCLFYETKEDLLDALLPFFKAALERNEFCLWMISDPLTEEDAHLALSRGVPGFDDRMAAGSLEFVPARAWYLQKDQFDLAKINAAWNEKLGAALAKGYDGMCVSGSAFWLETNYWNEFCEYEQGINTLFAGQRIRALCTYSLAASSARDILDVARAHHLTLARRNGKWDVIEASDGQARTHSLTPRELEVLAWVAQGKSAWEVGKVLHIKKRTVDEHVQTIIRKLGAVNRTQAVAIALHSRIIDV